MFMVTGKLYAPLLLAEQLSLIWRGIEHYTEHSRLDGCWIERGQPEQHTLCGVMVIATQSSWCRMMLHLAFLRPAAVLVQLLNCCVC